MRGRIALTGALLAAALMLLTLQVRQPERRAVGPVGAALLAVLGPAQSGLSRVSDSVTRLWRLYTDIGRLRIENTRLREEVERLGQEVARLREQAQATQRLERLLDFRTATGGRAIGARVIGRDTSQWFAVIVVDRGSRDGVRRNDPVVAAEGLVGRVLTVSPTTSQVLLITDARSAVGVVLQQSREAGVIEGLGQSTVRLKYLSRSKEVPIGAVVITSGLTGLFPRGLPVGTVVSLVREQGAIYQEATVAPTVNLDHLEEVLILAEGRSDR